MCLPSPLKRGRLVPFWLWVFRTSLYLIVAAMVLNTFMNRWGFRARSPRYGFRAIVTYEAHRPFAFRVLTPALVNAATEAIPRTLLDQLREWDLTRRQDDHPSLSAHRRFAWGPNPLPQDYVAYLGLWVIVFLLLEAMRWVTRLQSQYPAALVDCAPPLALLTLPLAFSRGVYAYDFIELLLVTVCIGALVKRRWVRYYATFVLACFNKETALLLVIYCVALQAGRVAGRGLLVHAGVHGLLGVPIVLWERLTFADNPGASAEFQLWENARFLSSGEPWLRLWDPYGPLLPFPGPFNLVCLVVAGGVVLLYWREKPRGLRLAFVAMTSVLLPIFVLFGTLDEVRNFSLVFPIGYLLGCHTAARLYGLPSPEGALAGPPPTPP